MLGITPQLLSRPLGHCRSTGFSRAVATRYKHVPLQPKTLRKIGSARFASKVAGDNESGHIQAGENEGIFFVDSE